MVSSLLQIMLVLLGSNNNVGSTIMIRTFSSDSAGEMLLYNDIQWGKSQPAFDAFYTALKGYHSLQDSLHVFDEPLLTLIDFSKPSNEKRLWVIDLESKGVLLNALVAHGRNSGVLNATRFSNIHQSLQSSLGFYATGSTYQGKHGLSLILHGLEPGINDQAERRAIVIHGADYVGEHYIRTIGRLGRSEGCPAVSMDVYKQLIKTIRNKTCVFIYHPATDYFQQSQLFKSKNETLFAVHATGTKSRF